MRVHLHIHSTTFSHEIHRVLLLRSSRIFMTIIVVCRAINQNFKVRVFFLNEFACYKFPYFPKITPKNVELSKRWQKVNFNFALHKILWWLAFYNLYKIPTYLVLKTVYWAKSFVVLVFLGFHIFHRKINIINFLLKKVKKIHIGEILTQSMYQKIWTA